MDKIVYTQEKMDAVKTQVQKLVEIVAEPVSYTHLKRISKDEDLLLQSKCAVPESRDRGAVSYTHL